MKEYKQTVNGVELTFLLSDEDAKARGLVETKQAQPANKSRKPKDKADGATGNR